MPGWTFIASANATLLAGLTPYFVDVNPSTWALDPLAVEQEIARSPAAVGAVMVVAPFGQPIDYAAWDDFKFRTGLPVVIDAAAAFDSLRVGKNPAVVSLHASKILGIGEGGIVASLDASLIGSIRQRSNFGFDRDRSAAAAGANAKLSEYQAAVGLASLDMWSETRTAWMSVAGAYREIFANSNRVSFQPGFGKTWVSSTCVVSVDEGVNAKAQQALAAADIETRLWWGKGAHCQPATVVFPRARLQVTDNLAKSTIGLPLYQDLEPDQVRHIAATLIGAVS